MHSVAHVLSRDNACKVSSIFTIPGIVQEPLMHVVIKPLNQNFDTFLITNNPEKNGGIKGLRKKREKRLY